jgi:hypothetical protein
MLRKLPGIPPRYCDFVDTASRHLDPARLAACGRHLAAQEPSNRWIRARAHVPSLDRLLGNRGTVIVFGVVDAAPAGGPVSSLLKALSVIQLAGILGRGGVAAAPVVLVAPAREPAPEMHYLDSGGGLVAIPATAYGRGATEFVAGIARRLGVGEDDELLALLLECYGKASDHGQGMTRFYEAILSPWNCSVVDVAGLPEEARSELLRPKEPPVSDAAAVVVGPEDFDNRIHPEDCLLSEEASPYWPRLSATLLDSRACKTLGRYGLDISDMFGGVGAVLERLGYEAMAPAVLQQFSSIYEQLSAEMTGLERTFPDDPKVLEALASTSKSIGYQLGRLRERFEPTAAQRLESARRQLVRLCNFVAPCGHTQETSLTALYLLVRFSRSVLEKLYSQLDVTRFEHQVINVE